MKNTKIDVFVPPGVQMKLSARLGTIPRQATPGVAAKIAQIWLVRNNCPENEIESLDATMEKIMVASVMAERARKPRVIWKITTCTARAASGARCLFCRLRLAVIFGRT